MVIGIDARAATGEPAGKGRYVLEIIQHLAKLSTNHTFRLYTRAIASLGKLPNNFSWRVVEGRGPTWHHRTARLANRECDVYLSTTSYLTPQLLRIPYALVIHDLVAFKEFAVPQRRARAIERATLRRAARRAGAILVNSETTARDLSVLDGALAGRITVTPLAAEAVFRVRQTMKVKSAVKRRYDLSDSFILSTGTLEPRKNLERLIRAYGALPPALRDKYQLVLAGKRGWAYEPIFATITEHELTDRVRYLDFVPDEELSVLYSACSVFCYPSLYEGFGLPVLEALQCGAPVITSNTSSLPEVGGEAARYINPTSVKSIREALAKLLRSPAQRAKLARLGPRQAKRFSWRETAQRTLEVLDAL